MIVEHHLPVTRTARYFTLGDPDETITDLWFACHGYGELAAEFAIGFEAVAAPGRLIVVPEALSRFYLDPIEQRIGTPGRVGATWMTREDRQQEIDDYIGYLDALHATVSTRLRSPPERIRSLGFSQGVATACRWAARGTAPLDELILWAGRVPEELDPGAMALRLRTPRVTIVLGTRDRYAKRGIAELEAARFRPAGVEPAVVMFEGGHRLDRDALRSIADRPRLE